MKLALVSRREILAFAAGATAVMALPKIGVAASRAIPRRAKRVLVINLSGGVRSSACFLASGSKALNPWGLIENAPMPLGKLLDDHVEGAAPPPQLYQLRAGAFAGERITPFRELGARFGVVGTWDPERGDHSRSERVMATGGTSASSPGLVVRLFAGLSGTLGKEAPETPPFVLGAAGSFASAPGAFARFAAVDITDPSHLPSAAQGTGSAKVGRGFAASDAARARLDEAFAAKMGPAGRELVDNYALDQRMSVRLGQLLSSPAVSLARGEGYGASLGKVKVGKKEVPLTNEMLLDALQIVQRRGFGGGGFGREEDPMMEAATAVRLLQVGSPAVAINMTGFDAHSGERQNGPRVYGQLGALWASLHFLLSHIVEPDEPGMSMLDRTLVVTTSEFGRDPGQARTGFNGGDGSDHGSHPACFYLAHAVMGAGVQGGRVVGGVSTETYDARKETQRYAPKQLLATIAYALGIDPAHPQWGFDAASPIDLWSAR